MYLLYDKKEAQGTIEFSKTAEISLAGNTNGIILRYLKTNVMPKDAAEFQWEIDVKKAIPALQLSGDTIVVDVKPNSADFVTLFELQKIYGVSAPEWTPIMLELKELLVDVPTSKWDKNHFAISGQAERGNVYTFLYLNGGVKAGKPIGTWNFPRPSSTNGCLLWPGDMKYFASKVR